MPRDFLHKHPQFADLIRIVANEKGIDPALVEKDYWIMHCLYGLEELGFTFQLKGGTSLSKGHKIIGRFSEDGDILIEPFPGQDVKVGKNQNSAAQIKTRTDFYDWLAKEIKINGISSVERDTEFDDLPNYRSAGIKLNYTTAVEAKDGLREGVLLEVGFDNVAPNSPKDISSWLYDRAVASNVDIVDNRAPWRCLAMTPAIPSSKSCRRSRRNSASSRRTAAIRSDSCATTTISTSCSNSPTFRNSSARTPTRRTSRRAFVRATTRTLPKTKPSF
jgi:hypothetical protein